MRTFIVGLIGLSLSSISWAQGDPEKELSWVKAFSPITASQADTTLALVVITNNQALIDSSNKKDPPPQQPVWCKADFEFSFRRAAAARNELATLCSLQYLAAGMPKWLSGGQDRNQPARCVVAVCDGHYRLLSMCVGVPTPNQLLTLIEDAQQVASLIKLSNSDQAKITVAVADQSMNRLKRIWKDSLAEMLAAVDVGAKDEAEKKATSEQNMLILDRIAQSFESVYLADVRLRFGLSESADRQRLVILEQHTEARQPWCDAMLPFVASSDFAETWAPITEAVWHHEPITGTDEGSEKLVDWYDTQANQETAILALQPNMVQRRFPWPPADTGSVAAKRGLGWKNLDTLIYSFPTYNVNSQQLAQLVRLRRIGGIDIQLPSRARYLVIEPKGKVPWAIREGDAPSKNIGRLKRHVK